MKFTGNTPYLMSFAPFAVTRSFIPVLLASLVVALSPRFVSAAYIAEIGGSNHICERYRDNLNAGTPSGAYSRDRPISSAYPEFKAVQWGRVPEGAKFPADAIVDFFWKRDANPAWYLVFPQQWSSWRGTPAQIVRAKSNYIERVGRKEIGYDPSVSFSFARIDIDNDGVSDPLIRFSVDGIGQLLLVLSPDGARIDHKKSQLVLRHPAWGNKSSSAFRKKESGKAFNPAFESVGLEPVEDALHGASYGVFSVEGKTYVDLWWLQEPSRVRVTAPSRDWWRLHVFGVQQAHVEEVCRFRFDTAAK